MKTVDEKRPITRCVSFIQDYVTWIYDGLSDYPMEGAVVTRHGIVYVRAVEEKKGWPNEKTVLLFAYGGFYYRRIIFKLYTRRGLATVARRYGEEIVRNHGKTNTA
jgi:hypothetical protein